ncbi:hypothetical protein [Phaffia rhodozyma]|uniref:RNA ligase/cyclic nucleotide phosphodiesterase n=1 Tax=Phaffia rhodozyma TaxID=264483 RepID=A0A0F7SV61_PHARH|nr:hypothetical protein [Phaffia rhodozyma]
MSSHPLQPFVLTLSLDSRTASSLTALRTKYFPAHRNHLSSHLTYFHALPAARKSDIVADLLHLASVTKPFEIIIGPPFMMGAGVGINIKSTQDKRIEAVHDKLLRRWTTTEIALTGQDKRKLGSPHATVMNKCSKEEADACYEQVTKTWKDRKGQAVGLQLWEYQKDGSWKFLHDFNFQVDSSNETKEDPSADMNKLDISTPSPKEHYDNGPKNSTDEGHCGNLSKK